MVGQAGHLHVPDFQSNILEGNQHLFNLEGQLAHKFDLINNHIDKKSKLHFIGHSIGAWMITELLQKHAAIHERTSSVSLLFPTLQRMADTRNGKFLNGFLRRIHGLVVILFSLLYLIPESIRAICIQTYLKICSLPPHYLERIMKYLHPLVNEKVLFLAYDEMDTVQKLNNEAIDKIKHLTYVIYSTDDGWAPIHYMDDLKPFEPMLQMKEVNIAHAFVLKSPEPVAEMVVDFIKTKL
ncbi:lipid droplet-associated hydrolase isoform X2 [Pectinophora gossypiella]|uniref:lipid droplet-associated hydrolase isoform X2 n=1 Tax=Pectinophora gossypiella TaxID=13191 RepID=UPI00214F15D2|nr:lipid droplet-associated hydrolase isoform X2 [Pectinophora gossypiella]